MYIIHPSCSLMVCSSSNDYTVEADTVAPESYIINMKLRTQ